MEAHECGSRGVLVRLIAGDPRPQGIRRQDLGWPEVTRCERALAATGRADQDHHARVGDDDLSHVPDDAPSPSIERSREGSVVYAIAYVAVRRTS